MIIKEIIVKKKREKYYPTYIIVRKTVIARGRQLYNHFFYI
jgi:hypothetical protein